MKNTLRVLNVLFVITTIFTVFTLIQYVVNGIVPSPVLIGTWGGYFAISMFSNHVTYKRYLKLLALSEKVVIKPGESK